MILGNWVCTVLKKHMARECIEQVYKSEKLYKAPTHNTPFKQYVTGSTLYAYIYQVSCIALL